VANATDQTVSVINNCDQVTATIGVCHLVDAVKDVASRRRGVSRSAMPDWPPGLFR
jgi:hypothetical protein